MTKRFKTSAVSGYTVVERSVLLLLHTTHRFAIIVKLLILLRYVRLDGADNGITEDCPPNDEKNYTNISRAYLTQEVRIVPGLNIQISCIVLVVRFFQILIKT